MKSYSLRPDIPEKIKLEFSSMPSLMGKLLYYRGITNINEADSFLNPQYDGLLHDPFLMKGMDIAVARVINAIEKNEKILIYSDYDADGIPGAVALKEFFNRIGFGNVENYIPHRHDEGYGLHLEAIDTFVENGVNLIITIDCGIADVNEISRATEKGIDVIVTDHHEEGNELPKALAILNPKQKSCTYPEKILCGSGVVFKLIQGILMKNRFGMKEGHEKWLLDLVGIATLSDMVPLVGENRALAHFGLKVLRKSPRRGLTKLWKKLKVDQRFISEDDIGFTLTPRLNAASRMGEPLDAFRLLATEDEMEADLLSDHLNRINDERKGVVASIVKDIKKRLSVMEKLPPVLVLGNPHWKPSLLGLAANSLAEDIGRPVFLWGRNGDSSLKGSCRSDGTVSVVELMQKAGKLFLDFGGHKMAGGFSVSHEKVHLLEGELSRIYDELSRIEITDTEWVDSKLTLNDVDHRIYNYIEKLSPYGVDNPKPKFIFEGVSPKGVKQFGKEKNHMELLFESEGGSQISAISFFSKPEDFRNSPTGGKPIDLIATIEKSFFRNSPEIRLRIVDII